MVWTTSHFSSARRWVSPLEHNKILCKRTSSSSSPMVRTRPCVVAAPCRWVAGWKRLQSHPNLLVGPSSSLGNTHQLGDYLCQGSGRAFRSRIPAILVGTPVSSWLGRALKGGGTGGARGAIAPPPPVLALGSSDNWKMKAKYWKISFSPPNLILLPPPLRSLLVADMYHGWLVKLVVVGLETEYMGMTESGMQFLSSSCL